MTIQHSSGSLNIRLNNHGVTLIELLMAIAIFATLSVLSFAGLNQIQQAQTTSEQAMQSLTRIQKALRRFELDLTQVVNRNVYSGDKTTVLSFTASDSPIPNLEFTRGGIDPQTNRVPSSLMRIGYQYEGETLYRVIWPVLDRSGSTIPSRYAVLRDITNLEIIYFDSDKGRHTQWPQQSTTKPTLSASGFPITESPVAVEIRLTSKTSGKFKKLIMLNNYLHSNLQFEPFK